jgi:hypothetical protein
VCNNLPNYPVEEVEELEEKRRKFPVDPMLEVGREWIEGKLLWREKKEENNVHQD